jgi:hypothetical protein
MLESLDEAPSVVGAAPAPADTKGLEIKLQPADAIFGSVPIKDSENTSTPKETHFFRSLLRFGLRAAVVVCLCGLAWAGGAYYSHGHSPFHLWRTTSAPDVKQSPQHDKTLSAMRHMAEEIRALKASVDSKNAVGGNVQSQKVLSATGATITDLAGRVDKLDAEITTKFSEINGQLAHIEQQVSAPHAVTASRWKAHRKHVEHANDAFDPSRDPAAPGVPRPLGARLGR